MSNLNLILNSRKSLSYSQGVCKFFVNWNQFFESDPNAKYNVSFSFSTEIDNTLDQDDIYTISINNFGSLMRTITSIGQFGVGSTSSNVIGIVYPENITGANIRLVAHAHDNPETTIYGRPHDNIIEVQFNDLTNVLSQKTPQFIMNLRFEKI